ncbi:MAG TPA: HAD hydrolase-like protein [Thermoanaerobaculia bacterium]|jgi:beta-phosphoglucomutase-like phosphatase (HAD superfamily)|nr:HAD hydrolase-like protein [Thermoanaerobaculia bacterium]
MHIALFDIDGTLTASNEIDSECFSESFRDVFGIDIDTNWDAYEHTTDRGIATEGLRRAHGREPAEHELLLHRTRFVQLLEARMTRLNEIAGAGAFLTQLLARDWRIALCTGAWSDSARLKLSRARLPLDLPLASCDDEISREDILQRGIILAGGSEKDTVVSFGDAPWDVRAARTLQLPFIGIASGLLAQTLRRIGAAEVFKDFRDATAVFDAIDRVTA